VTSRFRPLDVAIVGGGMITHDQILPSIYQLKRLGAVDKIDVCARRNASLRALKSSAELSRAFPDMDFVPHPMFTEPPDRVHEDVGHRLIASMAPRQLVIVAIPDAAHFDMVMDALRHDQHVICVKPLAQTRAHAEEIEKVARERGLFVGVEYHKRFDRRSLVAKRHYAEGRFGEFVMGEAKLHEPYAYRHSNFQTWFTCDQADPFTYVGCHYVDLVYFITGLRPVSVSVDAVKRRFPNGNEGYLWSSGRVRYENGALLTITNGLGYPDEAAGSNDQGLVMYCEGADRSGMIHHDDHERGVRYSFVTPSGGTHYRYVSPDYFRLVPWESDGLRPVGYGYDSIETMVQNVRQVEGETASLSGEAALAARREMLGRIDAAGLIATPANSMINELVIEAARESLAQDGARIDIVHG
jgi:D-galacturonate reductase